MRATIDDAGRVVIPKRLRDDLGLAPGPVEVVRDGAGVRIEATASSDLVEHDGRLVIPTGGDEAAVPLDDDVVRDLRIADQR